jgi:hypothetical protein
MRTDLYRTLTKQCKYKAKSFLVGKTKGEIEGGAECRLVMKDMNPPRTPGKFRLHLLIHTLPPGTSAPDVEKKKSGAKNSAFSLFKPRYRSLVARGKV